MKNKIIILLHVGYWILYLLLVSSFILVISSRNKHLQFTNMIHILFLSSITIRILLPAVISFYLFYFFLFAKYLNKKNAELFVFGTLISLFSAVVFTLLPSILTGIKNDTFIILGENFEQVIFLFTLILINGIIGLVLKGFIVAYGDIKFKNELAQKNYEMELSLVKSQISPHFLFNTINNIDVLIVKDAKEASVYLNKLSDILRFMLYETKTNKITLLKELDYIEKYIELQKIRTSNNSYLHYTFTGNAANILIAPMLLISFIENAFKYTENIKKNATINVSIKVEKYLLTFICENNYRKTNQTIPHGMLGNELIKKRLQLQYPNMHKLDIENSNEIYKVTLLIYYNEN